MKVRELVSVSIAGALSLIQSELSSIAQTCSITNSAREPVLELGAMAFYLGIDGGGTKTRGALGDENKVLATAVAGGSNVVRLGEVRAGESLHEVVRRVCEIAQVSPQQIHSICIGASGAGRPEIAGKVRSILAELTSPHAQIEVVGDTVIALEAAFGAGPGVIAISGTGSVVFGRDASGSIARAGGWGFAISDEGSGQWIGRRAVSEVLRAHDRGEGTALTALILETLILETWKLADLEALVQQANSTPPPEFQLLFPVVLRAAAEGDPAARKLLNQAGNELASLASTVLRRIAPAPPHVPVATTGSVFRQSAEVCRIFYNQLKTDFPQIAFHEDFVDPVMGALARARRA
jgi:glucosamine kinase